MRKGMVDGLNFLFACGGTAGHIYPALAIAAEIGRRTPGARFLFAGAGRELENRLIPHAGYELVNIKVNGLKRGFSPRMMIHNIRTITNLAAANAQAARIIKAFEPSAVIGTGGYICYPVLRTAHRMGIPTFIHESNAVPGLTTKLLSAYADKVLVSFHGLEKAYKRPERVLYTGTPVRDGFVSPQAGTGAPAENCKPLVVSFWGSLGAERMNEAMAEFIKLNIDTGAFNHIHATGGTGGAEEIKERLRSSGAPDELPPGVEVRVYIDDMPSLMSSADIILCRAGGSTIAELTAIGKPAVLVPSPYVTNNQQVENARQASKSGGAIMIDEQNCTGKTLFDAVSSILRDKDALARMSEAQKAMGAPDAASVITEIILEKCGNNG